MFDCRYRCDWCLRVMKRGETWILGYAAERRGAVSTRCEFSLAERWSYIAAHHPLAVHFCSEEHKNKYVQALFQGALSPTTQGICLKHQGTSSNTRSNRAQPKMSPPLGERPTPDTTMAYVPKKPPQRSARRRAAKKVGTAAGFAEKDGLRAHGLGVSLEG